MSDFSVFTSGGACITFIKFIIDNYYLLEEFLTSILSLKPEMKNILQMNPEIMRQIHEIMINSEKNEKNSRNNATDSRKMRLISEIMRLIPGIKKLIPEIMR